MLTRDVRLEGFNTADWVRLLNVLRTPPVPEVERPLAEEPQEPEVRPKRRQGGVIAVSSGQRLRKLISTRRGRLPITEGTVSDSLETLAERHSARWAIELKTGALEELMDRFGERLSPEQDILGQFVLLVGVLRELEAEGVLAAWPWRLSQWPVPSERLLMLGLDALCPEGKVVLLGVFEDGDLATCLAARRGKTGFDYLLGPDELRPQMGLTSGDWTRDYRHLVSAVEEKLGPLGLGCFGETQTFRELARNTAPGAWAEAVAGRDIIVSPIASALAIPLGIDAGRAALATMRGLAERLSGRPFFAADGPFASALGRVEKLPIFERDLKALIGFDPFSVLHKLLARDRDDA